MNFGNLKNLYDWFSGSMPIYQSTKHLKPEHPVDYLIPKEHSFNGYFRYLADTNIRYNFSKCKVPEPAFIFGIDSRNEMTLLMDLFRDEVNRIAKKDSPKIPFFMGETPNGEVVWADFAKINHLLISGVTGFGKSHLLNTIILSTLFLTHPNEVNLTVFDIKGLDFNCFENLVTLKKDPSTFLDEIKEYLRLIEYRNSVLEKEGCKNLYECNLKRFAENKPIFPYEIIIIDEYRLSSLDVEEFDLFVSKIASYGRASGFYLVISTQRASVDSINMHLRENIIHSVSFAQRTEGSSVIAGSKAAQKLHKKGQAVYSYIRDTEVKVPFYSDKYLTKAIKKLEKFRGLQN